MPWCAILEQPPELLLKLGQLQLAPGIAVLEKVHQRLPVFRPADLALADHHGVGVLEGLVRQCRDMEPAENDGDARRSEAIRERVAVLDLGRVGGDRGDIAQRQLVQGVESGTSW